MINLELLEARLKEKHLIDRTIEYVPKLFELSGKWNIPAAIETIVRIKARYKASVYMYNYCKI